MSLRSNLLTVAAFAALAVGSVAQQDSAAAPAAASTQTIELAVGRSAKDTFVDNGKKGESVGDSFISTAVKLRDPATRAPAGRLDILGTIASRRADFVAITAHVHGGTIQVNGVMRHTTTPHLLPVTGGTGNYANARGTLELDDSTGRATFTLLQ
jgi:hypothetical protein